MNSLLRCCIVVAAALGASACASQGYSGYASSAASQATVDYERDREYTAAVEQVARYRGVEVHWVNPPVRRVSVASADNGLD